MSVRALHDAAMDLADRARLLARRDPSSPEARQLYEAAFQSEAAAVAELLKSEYSDAEPGRSILLRSAAALANLAGHKQAAMRYLHQALAGEPPAPLDEEIFEELQQLQAEAHLALKGEKLAREEIQVSLAEADIGPGWADADDLVDRIEFLKQMFVRTAERAANRPFRTAGSPDPRIGKPRAFISAPRAQSFAFTVRFGTRQGELELPDTSNPGPILRVGQVLDEVVNCLELIEAVGEEALAERIPDESYRRHFIHAARELRPDGQRVGLVGLTLVRDGQERSLSMRPTPKAARRKPGEGRATAPGSGGPTQTTCRVLRGRLTAAATGRTDSVSITDAEGNPQNLRVQTGLIDIVRKHFGDQVEVKVQPGRRSSLTVIDIVTIDE